MRNSFVSSLFRRSSNRQSIKSQSNPRTRRKIASAAIEALESRTMLTTYNLNIISNTAAGGPGAGPEGGVVIDANGNLFGTGENGGSSNVGSVFELPAGSNTTTLLGSFIGNGAIANGDEPLGRVLLDSAGNLFGTADSGGPGLDGTVWEVPAGTTTPVVLGSFDDISPDGAFPSGGLVEDASGDLFGTTGAGGINNEGTIYEIPKGGSLETIASMSQAAGADPNGELVMDAGGNLYGTSEAGGPLAPDSVFGDGQIFELPKGASSVTVLATFTGGDGGVTPVAGLAMDSAGDLFGTASGQGGQGAGTIFELAKGANTITTLAFFTNGVNGGSPTDTPFLDANGNLFGTAQAGGSLTGAIGKGVVWELPKGSSTITDLAVFDGADGSNPTGPLAFDSNGDIFGACSSQGPNGAGTIFELTPVASAPPAKLAFTSPAPSPTAGQTITPPFTVQVEDANSNLLTSDNSLVTLSIESAPAGAALGGTVTEQAQGGIATFSDLSVNVPGPYILQATDPEFAGSTNIAFSVAPGGISTPPAGALTPAVVGIVPASVVATVKTRDFVTVDLANTGGTTIKGAYTLELLVSPDGQLNDATEILSLNKNLPALRAGRALALRVPLGAFPDVANGNYNILAQVTGALASGANVGASGAQVNIADPFVDLTDSLSFVGPLDLKPGKKFSVSVTVTNNGNVPARGPLAIQLGDSVNPDGSSTSIDATPTKNINLLPGRHVALRFSTLIPVGFVPGTYFGTATVDPGNTFSESDTTNNFAVSANTLTVLDPFANIQNIFSGPFKTTSGLGKGVTGTITLDVLTESDTTGQVTGTGTNSLGASFTFTGIITATGAFTFNTTDMNTAVTSVLSGRVLRGALVGKFANSTSSKGTFTLSPSA